MLDKYFYTKSVCFQNLFIFESFGKIFPKLDFMLNIIYTYNRGETMIERTEYLEQLKRFRDKNKS